MKSKIIEYRNKLIKIFMQPEMKILPGQLAFFFVLALVPTLTIISFFAKPLAVSLNELGAYYDLGRNVDFKSLLKPINIEGLSLKYIIILIVTMYIASNGMHSIIVTANNIYGIKEYNFFKARLKSILIMFLIVFLFMIILVLPVLASIILDILSYIPKYSLILAVLKLLRYPFLFLVIYVFIKIIYIVAPDKKVNPRSVNIGSLFCSLGWIIATSVYIYYVKNFANYFNYYNALAQAATLMLLVYILAYIFVIGLALNFKTEN